VGQDDAKQNFFWGRWGEIGVEERGQKSRTPAALRGGGGTTKRGTGRKIWEQKEMNPTANDGSFDLKGGRVARPQCAARKDIMPRGSFEEEGH